MINILVNGLTHTFGGIESLFYSIIQYSDKDKYHFDFLCFENFAARSKDFEDAGSNIYYIPRPGRNYTGYKDKLDDIFAAKKYDIYHVNLTRYKPDYDIKVAKKSGCKIIIHSHLTGINRAKNPIYTVLRYLEFAYYKKPVINSADLLMACSRDAGEYLFGNLPCKILYNGIDYNKFYYSQSNRIGVRNEFGIKEEDVLIGNVGRLTIQKNQLFLLKVFKKAHELNHNLKLMIVGDGEQYDELNQYIIKNDLVKSVILTGNRSDVDKILSGFDCFVLPSIREALPISLIEAQVNGLKCLISDNITREVDISDLIRIGVHGDIFDEWVQAFVKLEKRKISDKNVTNERFKIEYCTHELQTIYSELLS